MWVEGRGYARSGQVEKNDMGEWKQQPVARWKKYCLNHDDDDDELTSIHFTVVFHSIFVYMIHFGVHLFL